jgi:hypothetical protein
MHGSSGLGLFLGDSLDRVCRNCGQERTPQLVALLDLAHVAERVGTVRRYLLVPPMESLLDLARAAEEYSTSAPKALKRAA